MFDLAKENKKKIKKLEKQFDLYSPLISLDKKMKLIFLTTYLYHLFLKKFPKKSVFEMIQIMTKEKDELKLQFYSNLGIVVYLFFYNPEEQMEFNMSSKEAFTEFKKIMEDHIPF